MTAGVIKHRSRAKQLIDFRNLTFQPSWGNTPITPTDIDCFIEQCGKSFIFGEYKLNGVEIGKGQLIAFERLIDSINAPAIFFIAYHSAQDPHKDIDGASAIVHKVYYKIIGDAKGRWVPIRESSGRTVAEIRDAWLRLVEDG